MHLLTLNNNEQCICSCFIFVIVYKKYNCLLLVYVGTGPLNLICLQISWKYGFNNVLINVEIKIS